MRLMLTQPPTELEFELKLELLLAKNVLFICSPEPETPVSVLALRSTLRFVLTNQKPAFES